VDVVLWWIGNLALAFVVLPLVWLLLNRVIRPIYQINEYADDILVHGVGLTGTLDAVPKLVTTKELTGAALGLVGRYGAAIKRLL
jgi:hypothetical protein